MLAIHRLNKTYPSGIRALRDVSIEIDNGVFGLLGPNGAGKSTLMRTLATLQTADSGDALLDGTSLFTSPRWTRERLGYLPQEFGVYPQVTAEDFVDQIAVYKGFTQRQERHEMVADRLNLVNLYERRRQRLGTFSGGMKKRVGIAQALLGDPSLLIVDEPTAGLDPAERVRLQNLLADLACNRILILSTHIVEDVADLCDHVAIMNEGAIIRKGTPSELVLGLDGMVWVGDAAAETDESLSVITRRIVKGKKQVRVLSDAMPGEGFRSAEADLNDVYFTAQAEVLTTAGEQ